MRKRLLKFGMALTGFIIGAATGALGLSLVGFWAIVLPTLTISLLALKLQHGKASV